MLAEYRIYLLSLSLLSSLLLYLLSVVVVVCVDAAVDFTIMVAV